MTDRIRIDGLRVETRIGVTSEERSNPRPVVINAELRTDARRAGRGDDLSDTVDYHRAVVEVAALVRSGERKLIERLAEEIAALLAGMNGVVGVTVQVVKEAPPIDEDVAAVSITVERP